MTTSTLLLLFLCVGTVFVYREEMRSAQASARLRLGWRLACWGGAAMFLLGAMLASDTALVSPALKWHLFWVALFCLLIVLCGVVVQWVQAAAAHDRPPQPDCSRRGA
jgi:hypothetical protein